MCPPPASEPAGEETDSAVVPNVQTGTLRPRKWERPDLFHRGRGKTWDAALARPGAAWCDRKQGRLTATPDLCPLCLGQVGEPGQDPHDGLLVPPHSLMRPWAPVASGELSESVSLLRSSVSPSEQGECPIMVPVGARLAPLGPPGKFHCDFEAKRTGLLSLPPPPQHWSSSGGTGPLFPTPSSQVLLRGHSAWGIAETRGKDGRERWSQCEPGRGRGPRPHQQ